MNFFFPFFINFIRIHSSSSIITFTIFILNNYLAINIINPFVNFYIIKNENVERSSIMLEFQRSTAIESRDMAPIFGYSEYWPACFCKPLPLRISRDFCRAFYPNTSNVCLDCTPFHVMICKTITIDAEQFGERCQIPSSTLVFSRIPGLSTHPHPYQIHWRMIMQTLYRMLIPELSSDWLAAP